MTRKTYSINDQGERKLVYQQTYDDQNRVVSYIDFNMIPPSEKAVVYNENGLICSEIEMQEGVEIDKVLFEFDHDNRMTMRAHYLSGELYEQQEYNHTNDKSTRKTFIDGDLVETMVLTRGEDGLTKSEFFDGDQLLETQNRQFDNEQEAFITTISNGTDVYGTKVEKENTDKNLIHFQEFNENSDLMHEEINTYDGKLLLKSIIKYYKGYTQEEEQNFTYDNQGNLLRVERRALSGALLGFHDKIYNNSNQLIKEVGHSSGHFDAIFGTYKNGEAFHYEHVYEGE